MNEENLKRGNFKKGQSGNPSGRPKIPNEVKKAFKTYTMEAIDTIVDIMRTGTPSLRYKAAEHILDRVIGKPVASVDASINNPVVEKFIASVTKE